MKSFFTPLQWQAAANVAGYSAEIELFLLKQAIKQTNKHVNKFTNKEVLGCEHGESFHWNELTLAQLPN